MSPEDFGWKVVDSIHVAQRKDK